MNVNDSQYLKYSLTSLYGNIGLAPTISIAIKDMPGVGGVVFGAGLVSNLISYKIAKAAMEKGWEKGSAVAVILLSSLAIFTVSACAMAVFGVSAIFTTLAIGVGVSCLNAYLFSNSIDEAHKMGQNHRDWAAAKMLLQNYEETWKSSSKDEKHFSSPNRLRDAAYNMPETGSVFLITVQDQLEKLKKSIQDFNNRSLKAALWERLEHYFALWDNLVKKELNRDGLLSDAELEEQIYNPVGSAQNSDAVKAQFPLAEKHLEAIRKRYADLGIAEPAYMNT